MNRYPELPASTTALEDEILERWEEEGTFAKSLEQNANGEPFVFYEGPPTANGRPGIHHVFSRTIKDSVARFRTMQGRYVPRVAGWDTHGLPVEIEAEKRLGISGKPEIEKLGIARFNEVCRESVLTYTEEWERFSSRIGYWLDYSRPYVTYRPEYIESVWWILKQIADSDLIYRGHKILPYCPRCGTGLSSHEVALGYKDVMDPSLYLTMPLLGEDGEAEGRALLVWTTTPWTLVSNVAVAVNPELEYAEVQHDGQRLIVAKDLVVALFGEDAEVARSFPAQELVDLRYSRPFDWVNAPDGPAGAAERAWRVVPAEFVSAADGTGLVHMSPAYGADDYAVGREQGLPVLQAVDDRGQFHSDIPEVGGQFVKDADTQLVKLLKQAGRVFDFARKEHSYPHCWRCGSPLLYMARDSWFIRTTALRKELLANNRQVNWHPPEVGTGRFGEWLENNVDWALSRNRFWGTPLPAWICDKNASHVEFIGSFADLRARAGDLPEPFDPHRPFIDEIHWGCEAEKCGGTMHRTPEVIDVWFDSGSMPYAKLHYPFENEKDLESLFPADFICEGVDQTRGWFYSLMAISTLLGKGPAFRNVVVNDLVLDADGQKMSKSKGNVVNPWEAIDEFGADAIRWYMLTTSNPWLPKRFDPAGVREVQRKVFDTLRNSYRFFALYANLEEWSPGENEPDPAERTIMDLWLLSRLSAVSEQVSADLETYDLTHAVRAIGDFIVDDLSNWYVRRSRDRFWGSADRPDARAAFATLHQVLVEVSRLAAPVVPFLSDWLHRALSDDASVHLAAFPTGARARDEPLEVGMSAVRQLSTLGRAAREEIGIRVRQPLGTLYAVTPEGVDVDAELLEILRDELNVHSVEFMDRAEELVTFSARPNFRALGARFGKKTPDAAEAIRGLSSAALASFRKGDPVTVSASGQEFTLKGDYLEIMQTATGEHIVQAEGGYTVALDPTITPELRAEGLARELINRVQRLRRDSGFEVSDRIRLEVAGDDELLTALRSHQEFVAGETLAAELVLGEAETAAGANGQSREVDLDGVRAFIAITR